MANGRFSSSVFTDGGDNYTRYVEVIWKSVNNAGDNTSTIEWEAYVRSTALSTTRYVYAKQIHVKIGDNDTLLIGNSSQKTYKDSFLGSGSSIIHHDMQTGRASVPVSITARFMYYGADNSTYYGNIDMSPNPRYKLSIGTGTGYSVSVNRTTSAGGSVGIIEQDPNPSVKNLYYGDVLKITATPGGNYSIKEVKVNGSVFSNGASHTVKSDVTISVAVESKVSKIQAEDMIIGQPGEITVTRFNKNYTHTIKYKFGNQEGTIINKSSSENISWTPPDSFYREIPDNIWGECALSCITYNGNVVVGNSVPINIRVGMDDSAPSLDISGVSYSDVNPLTANITGNRNVFIKGESIMRCTLTGIPKKYSKIVSVATPYETIAITDSEYGVSYSFSKDYKNIESIPSFIFNVKDSRGLGVTQIPVAPSLVPYVPLSSDVNIKRESPTSGVVFMNVSGNFYNGTFVQGVSNNLLVKYKYRAVGDSVFSNIFTIDNSNIRYTNNNSGYTFMNPVQLNGDFNYLSDYEIRVIVSDSLHEIEKKIILSKGVPLFDWGENDFAFHVPVNSDKDISTTEGVSAKTISATGNISTDRWVIGSWLQTTANTALSYTPPKFGVLDNNGWLYSRTLEEVKSDLGIPNAKTGIYRVPYGYSIGIPTVCGVESFFSKMTCSDEDFMAFAKAVLMSDIRLLMMPIIDIDGDGTPTFADDAIAAKWCVDPQGQYTDEQIFGEVYSSNDPFSYSKKNPIIMLRFNCIERDLYDPDDIYSGEYSGVYVPKITFAATQANGAPPVLLTMVRNVTGFATACSGIKVVKEF